MIGETLAQYRIEAVVGSGGMGVVYRAHDERLDRMVALKILGDETGGAAPDRAALLHEARSASGLNHPHICTVYEVGEAEGHAFIVMEFVDGQPLSRLIPHGGMPSEAVVRYGLQIADALDHAHEHGVIHRDLKTANVVISREGHAKVLDFGLARRVDDEVADVATRSGSTVESDALAGTLAYMAPEVLVGRINDARSDIWALGVVLYEMATGELPFTGRNAFDVTAAILRAPTPAFPAHVPPMLRGIVQRCLAKDPRHRYQRAGEARAALEAVQSDVTVVPLAPASPFRRHGATLGVSAVLVAALAWAIVRDTRGTWERTGANGRLRSVVSSEERTVSPALSADGGMLAYVVVTGDGRVDLYARRVAGGALLRLTNDAAREDSPHFSPDGERVAFTRLASDDAAAEIRIVPTLGGDARLAVQNAAYPAWSPDGTRLAYVQRREDGTGADLAVSNVDGSAPRVVLRGDSAYPFLRDPAWSPDGRELAVVRSRGGTAAEIWRVAIDGGAPIPAREEPASIFSEGPVYTYDGRGIIHSSNRGGATNIWYVPLQGGVPIRLTSGPGPDESPSVARNGSIAFVNSQWRYAIERHDLMTGDVRPLVSHAHFLWGPAVSPDGHDLAFSRSETDGSWHIWVAPLSGGPARQLTDGAEGELYPRYTADGRSILFQTWSVPRRIGRVSSDGGPLAFLTIDGGDDQGYADMSPDGRFVAFSRPEADAEHLYITSSDGGPSRLLTASPGTVPRWSPDGMRLAFSRNRGYSGGIGVIAADGSGERQVSPEGGWPVWWPDGRQIGYLVVGADGNQQIEVVSLDDESTSTLESVRLVGTNHPFAVLPDARSLVVSNSQHLSDQIWLLEPPE